MTATLPTPLTSQYDPSSTEAKWQRDWETYQVFKAEPGRGGKPYCIVIPPPNVTGSLHMGHAFNMALIDTLVRYHRMKGDNTLCLPGTDHASIAVSTILEKQLKAEGKTRQDLSREDYLNRAWAWKAQSGGTIVNQLRRLGASVDWSRERFTMDEGLSQAVLEAFIRLYQEGLIYRGNYLVNWCPASQSAVSDLEVENQEVNGHLWHFRYPLSNESGSVEVATTRPETMLGDTAVAVNPRDDRYRHLIGKTVTLPILRRQIPIIGDELVDPSFGTGCVKVTPAHDPNDFEMGKRHQLPFINIMNKDGSMNENAGPFQGQDRFEARKNVVAQLEAEGFLVNIEDYKHTVPYSDRGKVPVEPLLSTQWFVKIEPLAKRALTALDQQTSPQFVPERWAKVYRDWLANLRDWCISRQLWWGHQIPAWYAVSETGGEINDYTPFIVARNATEAQEKAVAQFGPDVQLQQDPDVLDTWFSSGLWPFSTLGWPEQTAELKQYYPTSTMVTGFDIIFFWVARMTMMGSHFTGEMPFQDVYIHGLVRDENNKKMSKTAGNGIDPLLLIQKYGADALRYTLIREVAGAGQDIRLEYNRKSDESASVEASRNFANKLWNASRFVMLNLDGQTPQQLGFPNVNDLELADRWILSRYQQLVQQTAQQVESYSLGEAAKGLYEFIWGDFCDWYIELVKPRLKGDSDLSRRVAQQVLAHVLEGTLKLLHPFMPHITEELWQTLTQAEVGTFLAVQPYPSNDTNPASGVTPDDNKANPGNRSAAQPASPAQHWTDRSKTLLTLPAQLGHFAIHHPQALILAILALVVVVALRITFGLIDALDNILLLGSFFQLVGFGYSVWFASRYLLWAKNREELGQRLQSLTAEIIGELALTPPSDLPEALPEQPVASESSSEVTESFFEEQPALDSSLPQAFPGGTQRDIANDETPVSSSVTGPVVNLINPDLEQQFNLLIDVIRTIRNLRAEAEIKPGIGIEAILQSESDRERQILTAGQSYIHDIGRVETLTITPVLETEPQQTIVGVVDTVQVLVPLAGVIDVTALRAKIEKDLAKVEAEIQALSARLSNPGFVDKAPAAVVQGARDALAAAQKQQEILQQRLSRL